MSARWRLQSGGPVLRAIPIDLKTITRVMDLEDEGLRRIEQGFQIWSIITPYKVFHTVICAPENKKRVKSLGTSETWFGLVDTAIHPRTGSRRQRTAKACRRVPLREIEHHLRYAMVSFYDKQRRPPAPTDKRITLRRRHRCHWRHHRPETEEDQYAGHINSYPGW